MRTGWRTSPSVQRVAIVAAALLITLVVYARGLVTPLGIKSFGREFGWYVNYFDFGFVHRALIGTIMAVFVHGRVGNSYSIPFAAYPILLLGVVAAAWFAARRWFLQGTERNRYLAILLLSPAFVSHYAYSTGDFNVVLSTILLLSLVWVRRRVVPVVLLAIAMAVHEIFFVVYAPAMCVAIYVADGRRLGRAMVYAALAAALFVLFARFGTIHMSNEQFLAIMNRRAHLSYNAYFEMTGNFQQNVTYTRPLFSSFRKISWIVPSLVYWLIVTTLFFPRRDTPFLKLIYLAAVACPLLLIPFGTDLFRWTAMASVVAIGLGGFLCAQSNDNLFVQRPRLALWFTLPWILLGPFGATCDPKLGCLRAFPMSQFALDRL